VGWLRFFTAAIENSDTMSNHKQQPSSKAKIVSLHSVVDELLSSYERITKDHKRIFINEVPRKLSVAAGNNRLIPELGDLFAIISSNPGKNCIRISAENTHDDVKLSLKPIDIRGFSFSGIRVHAA